MVDFNPIKYTTKTLDELIQKTIINHSQYIKNRVGYTGNTISTYEIIEDNEAPIAWTIGNHIKFNTIYLNNKSETEIIGVCVHELVHIFQDGQGSPFSWQIEGVADIIRMEITGEKWIEAGDPHLSYRHSAMFLQWLETTYKKNIVLPLSIQIREKTYSDNSFMLWIGKTLDELISDYLKPKPEPITPKQTSYISSIIKFLKTLLKQLGVL